MAIMAARQSIPNRLWSLMDIAAYMGRSRSVAKLIVAQPGFPAPIKLWAGSHPRWIERQVRDWVEAQQEAA